MSQDDFNDHLIAFLDSYYPDLLEKLDDELLEKVMETMTIFILKDRHNKGYKITEGLNFSEWNSLVNQPKVTKFIEFFSKPENAFIYCYFYYNEWKALVTAPTSSWWIKRASEHKEGMSLFNQMQELFHEFIIFVPETVQQELQNLVNQYSAHI